MSQGQLFVISAPSGAGKTSLIKALREQMPDIGLSVSHTTRPMRPGEVDGQHYHFVSKSTFESMIAEGAFVEHALVFGNHYGTSKAAVSAVLDKGQDLILEIDWQGAEQVRPLFPVAQSIFILPPSREALRERLFGRGQDDADVIARRLAEAEREMQAYPNYDFLIINDDFSQALNQLRCLFESARLRTPRQAEKERIRLENLLNTPKKT
ncbi:MAG: guanylate kinase [Halothiobacillus sp. 14-56-357]|jgi:guanylate kinase|uniref:guanylate kinase n=1 Tax=Halothiobacillus sp. 15-55-196 TaxID=1970382 RepID=UPI000BD811FE|nr:guanylate kinase [Halothiobacillus sp. 15-55-196]OZB36816.1 MAG: guanylate kinase [Halothiobacillus sp. 15-55-196]OZB57018.1 MAG: guanylate kinase [Halothiobacillus sp. 14-56-357]OZB78604.1 MAG: guanylate kinase [Halothiobacillus sp. 13-55-115]